MVADRTSPHTMVPRYSGAERRTRRLCVLAFVLLTQLAAGCIGATLPSTDIPDNDDTRAIHAKVLAYKEAMNARDTDAIMALVSHRYYENGGTTETDRDDYGYEKLRDEVLPRLRQNVKAVHYQVIFRRTEIDTDRAYADYEFFSRFQYVEGGREAWDQNNDFNRLEFRREEGEWMIVAGL